VRPVAEWLSPILVKELRQGVRGNVFTASFLLLQGLMVLALGLTLVDPSNSRMVGFFWTMLALPVLVVLPLSGAQALSAESTQKTLEPMLLTRLSPRAIVFGKWASLAAQNLILVSSIAPYVLLRYFLGDVDVAQDAWMLLDFVVTAGVAMSIMVAMSALSVAPVFRLALAVPLLVMAFLAQPLFLMRNSSFGGPAVAGSAVPAPMVALGLAMLTVVVMIEGGAWQIAPAADRTSATARALVLAALPLVGLASRGMGGHSLHIPASLWAGALATLVAMGSLCEPMSEIPVVYARRFQRGLWRRAAGWIFAPGWASGVLFTALASVTACLALQKVDKALARPDVIAAVVAALYLPIPLRHALPWRRVPLAGYYLVVQALSWVLGALAPMGDGLESPRLKAVGAWLLPLSPILKVTIEEDKPALTSDLVDRFAQVLWASIIGVTLVLAVRALRRAEALGGSRGHGTPSGAQASDSDSTASAA
jgi:hypothetical protein